MIEQEIQSWWKLYPVYKKNEQSRMKVVAQDRKADVFPDGHWDYVKH